MAVLMAILAVLSASKEHDTGRIELRSGDRLSGSIESIDAQGTIQLDGQLVTGRCRARAESVRQVVLSGEAADRARRALRQAVAAAQSSKTSKGPSARPVAVHDDGPEKLALADGSILSGMILSLDPAQVSLSDTLVGNLKVARPHVRAVVFSGFYDPQLATRPKPDYLLFANGDELSAEVLGLAEGKVSAAAFFGKATIDAAELSFVAFTPGAKISDEASARAVEAVLVNGDVLRGEIDGLDDKALKLRTSWAGALTIPREAIAWISFVAE